MSNTSKNLVGKNQYWINSISIPIKMANNITVQELFGCRNAAKTNIHQIK